MKFINSLHSYSWRWICFIRSSDSIVFTCFRLSKFIFRYENCLKRMLHLKLLFIFSSCDEEGTVCEGWRLTVEPLENMMVLCCEYNYYGQKKLTNVKISWDARNFCKIGIFDNVKVDKYSVPWGREGGGGVIVHLSFVCF